MSDLLHLSLLGPPVIHFAETPLAVPRRQVRALLMRLAVEARPLSRSYLGCLFWGDYPESTAQRNLSRLLVYLARSIPAGGVLQIDDACVQLVSERIQADTRVFLRCWDDWERTHAAAELKTAVNLFRGPFLDGFTLPGNNEFGEWLSLEQQIWEQRYLKALEALIDETAAQGDLLQAVEYAHQYVQHNPLAEAIHCRLMELYAALGNRSAALRQYEQCSEVLERDLGVKPAPETAAAYQAILTPGVADADLPVISVPWTSEPGIHTPFVGRQKVLQQLNQCLERARTGDSGVVLLSGESGIGKTRLLHEFTHRQRLRTRLISGCASPETRSMPYQPIVEALRPLIRAPDILPNIQTAWLIEASRLMPELAAFVPQTQPPAVLEGGEARARIFEALCRIVFVFTRGGATVLLCLDDLHWADSTTLDWLAYLSRRLRGQRVLVLGSYRQDESDHLADLRLALSRQVELTELPLLGLNEEETGCLISSLGREIPIAPQQVERVRRATGGNPFFILETLRAIHDSGVAADLDSVPLPDTVRQAVNVRLDRLQTGARQILEAGAVLGPAFDFESILSTGGRGEMETLDGLDELVARQFLLESESGYRFCHAIVREAVYAGLSVWRRCRLHRRAGEALEKLRPDDALALAGHFEQAGEEGKSAGYYLQAGRAARAVFSHVEARGCLDRSLDLLASEAKCLQNSQELSTNRCMRIQTLFERGWVLRLLGEMSIYARDLEEIAGLANALGDPALLARLHWQQAYNHRWFCRYDAARKSAQEGVRLSREIGDEFLGAVCQRELGMAARETGNDAEALPALEQALEIFERIREIVYTIHTIGNLSTLFLRMQATDRAVSMARRGMEICDRLNLQYERRIPLGDLGVALAALGDVQQARLYLEESHAIAREIADRTQEIFCLGHLGRIHLQEGRGEIALQRLGEALSLAEGIGSISEQSGLHAGLAEAYLAVGDGSRAAQHADTALEIAESHGRERDAQHARQIRFQIDSRQPT